jgi:hypothetical protein
MSKSFFIGVGGTGSRCLESLVHFCAAGLGPETLNIGIVDQDQSNGNVARARQLVDLYSRSRSFFRQPAKNNLASDHDFLKTDIQTPQGDTVWCPLPNTASSLRKVFNYSILKPDLKGLFDCLYSPAELDLHLEEGFRGKPHIGAAAILANMNMADGFWRSIASAINTARGGDDVNIFLAGSIFGGMGASGFPTIVRKLRRILDEEGLSSGIKIGGALFLPYFNFPPPGLSDDKDVAYSEAFLEQTQGALHYYHGILETQPDLFDALYLVGWDPLISLDNHQKGGAPQVNPPMVPELYGCFAALDFFKATEKNNGKIFHIGRSDDQEFNWSDFPPITDDVNDTKTKLGKLLRFSFAYKHIYRPSLDRNSYKKYQNEAWFRRMISGEDIDLNHDNSQNGLDLLEDYAEELMHWTASLIYTSSKPGQPVFNLFSPEHFAFLDDDEMGSQIELFPFITQKQRSGFSDLLKGQTSRPLHRVYEELTYTNIKKEHTGLSSFCGTLYDACEP